jgi:hypothetical protein
MCWRHGRNWRASYDSCYALVMRKYLEWLRKVPIPALLLGAIAFSITGSLPIPIGAAAMNVLASLNSWIIANTKYPTLTLFFFGLLLAWMISQIAAVISNRPEELRLRLAQLRTEGVAIRNRAPAVSDMADWSKESLAWMGRTERVIRAINRADAEWFTTLDTVPPSRAFAEHDFWLVKLEQLITRYSVAS